MSFTQCPCGHHHLGSYENPVKLDGPIPEKYPEVFADHPYIYVIPKGGTRTKWYRSYADYCD